MKKGSRIYCLLLVVWVIFILPANAETFGINFLGNTTASVTGSAGVAPIANWNNITNGVFTSGPIYSSDGAISATLIMSGSGQASGWSNTSTADGGNGSLMRGYSDARINNPVTNTISALTGSNYTVYLYLQGDVLRPSNSGDRLPNYTVNGITYYTAVLGGAFTGFVRGVPAPVNSSKFPPALIYGNYIKLEDVVPVSGVIMISANSDNQTWRSPLNGIELVAVTTNASANITAEDIDLAINAFNAAYVVNSGSLTYYATSLNNRTEDYFWCQALDIQGLEDAWLRTQSPAHQTLISNMLDSFLVNESADWTWNDYNDDLFWATIAFARGYQITGKTAFLNQAIYGFNLAYDRGWDSVFGGGIWWSVDKSNKNVLSNDPGIITACYLYEFTEDITFLNKAQQIYAWVRSTLYNTNTGAVYGEITTNGVNTSTAVFNQGAFIGAANHLYRITGNQMYFDDALRAVEYVRNNSTANGLLSNGTRDGTWVSEFARGLGEFVRDNNLWSDYYPWMLQNANAAWNDRRKDFNLTWNSWLTSTPKTNTLRALECVSAVVMLQVTPPAEPGFVACTNRLAGTTIGTAGSFGGSGNTIAKVFDGNLSTFFDAPVTSGAWAGLDFGAGVSNVIGQISYWPRTGFSGRMVGGVFQGDNNPAFSNPVTLHTIVTAPPENGIVTSKTITNTKAFRYVRYLGPANGWCNVAEVQFFAPNPPPPLPGVPSNLTASALLNKVSLKWNAASDATGYNVKRSLVSGGPYLIIATNVSGTNYLDSQIAGGSTYYYVVSALNSTGESADSVQASATVAPFSSTLTSPDGNAAVTIDTSSGDLRYSTFYRGAAVIESSTLGFILNNTNVGLGVTLGMVFNYVTNETFISRHGIHAVATNNYQAQSIVINHAGSGVSYLLNLRAYDNGIAFRYELTNAGTKTISAESSSFVIPSGSTVWADTNTSNYEKFYVPMDISAWQANIGFGPPVTIQLAGTNGYLALTESSLGIFGNSYITKVADPTGRRLQVGYPLNQGGSTGISVASAVNTPWNVIMVGADLGALMNNDIVESLSSPPDPVLFPQGTATDWATAGRSVWDYLRPQPGGITPNNAMTNSLWASRMGFEYNTIDEGWANWTNASGVIDPWPLVQQVASFSHAAGVKVLFWKRSSELATAAQRTNFFQQLKDYGADGFKADFFDFSAVNCAAKERVALQEDVLREAAPYHLVVNLHGTAKPSGQFRTYPNLLNVEAVFGKEQFPNPWMIVTLPFMRFLAGPADFTPMEFGGNKAFEIANVINMPGPLITFAERSDNIAKSDFASLIRTIPCQWDETIVLPQSQLGRTTATARRNGADWFVGIMNATATNNWSLPLTFLSSNVVYAADIIRENSAVLEKTNATQSSTLLVSITTTNGSGFVAHFYPSPSTINTNLQLAGAIIGTSGSWNNSGNTKEKVFDNNLTTFFDSPNASGDWVGLDLGGNNQKIVRVIRYCPRSGWASRMVEGVFEGASTANFSDAVRLYTVGFAPAEASFTTVTLTNNSVFRYLRYVSPANGNCNVAELQFFGAAQPAAPTGMTAVAGVNRVITSWNAVTNATGYNLKQAMTSGGPFTIVASNLSATAYTNIDLPAGLTNYYVVSATMLGVESANSAEEAAVTLSPSQLVINLARQGSNLLLSWPTDAKLLEATNVTGPWTINSNTTSPAEINPTERQKFFRLIQP